MVRSYKDGRSGTRADDQHHGEISPVTTSLAAAGVMFCALSFLRTHFMSTLSVCSEISSATGASARNLLHFWPDVLAPRMAQPQRKMKAQICEPTYVA
jgi:hypothetical protein